MDEKMGLSHQIMLYNREKGNLTGILDVISFDENTIVLDTDMGLLTIKGKDLHVSRLTLEKGEIDIEGQADSLVYSSSESFKKTVSAKYCYAAHESRLHQNDRCKRFALCLVLTVRFRSLAPWGKLFQLFI